MEGLDEYVLRAISTFGTPGIAVAIVKDDNVVYSKGFGRKNVDDVDVPTNAVDSNTLFPIGSNTKAFTTALLSMLVDEGKISWDDRLADRVKDLSLDDRLGSTDLRIRDALCHRSCFGLGQGDLMNWPLSTLTRDDIVKRIRYLKPQYPIRAALHYNNILYVAMGHVIAESSGEDFESFVKRRIFAPLQMDRSHPTGIAFDPADNWASPHQRVKGVMKRMPFDKMVNMAPAGAICSSVNDMSKWIRMLLNGGSHNTNGVLSQLISKKSLIDLWSQQSVIPIPEYSEGLSSLKPNFNGYGLGWKLQDYKGRKLVSHSGGVTGFTSRVILVPEEKLGVVVLTNAYERGAFESIAFQILNIYLGGTSVDLIAAFKAEDEKAAEDAKKAMEMEAKKRMEDGGGVGGIVRSPNRYCGRYKDDWYGYATISLSSESKDSLQLCFETTNNTVGDLRPVHPDTFEVMWRDDLMENAYVTFKFKPNGTVDHFTMVAVSPLADFSFDYQDLHFVPTEQK